MNDIFELCDLNLNPKNLFIFCFKCKLKKPSDQFLGLIVMSH
jgi:hypothetical protein